MLTATTLGKENVFLLGRLLLTHQPDLAKELLTTYGRSAISSDDLSRIDNLFQSFCRLRNIIPEQYTGALYKTSKVEERRLFISVILHIYSPQVFSQPAGSIFPNLGLVTKLSSLFKHSKGNVSGMIRKVIAWESAYDDFAGKVSAIV